VLALDSSDTYTVLFSSEMPILADSLGESPEGVLAVHALWRKHCQALIVGEFPVVLAALIQRYDLPSEPTAFGTDTNAIWKLLQVVQGWDCVNVANEVAEPLGTLIQKRMGISVRYYGDIYYTLINPVVQFRLSFAFSSRANAA
jgi:hypothetical protein